MGDAAACAHWQRAVGWSQVAPASLLLPLWRELNANTVEMLSRAGPEHSEVVHHLTFFFGFFFLSLFNSGYILWRNMELEMVVSALGDRLGAEIVLDLSEKWSRKIRGFSSIKEHSKLKPSPTGFAFTWSRRRDDPTPR